MKNFTSQSKQIALLVICAFIAVAASPSQALAEAPIDRVVEAFQSVLRDNRGVGTYLHTAGIHLFWILAVAQIAWNFCQLAMEGRVDAQSAVMCMTRNIIVLGFLWVFMSRGLVYFEMIINSFLETGKSLSGAATTAEMISLGQRVSWGLVHTAWEKSSGLSAIAALLVAVPCSLIILLAFAMTVLSLIIGICKAYLSATVAIYFVGFAGCQYTRDIAITAYKAVYCAGVELFVMLLLFGAGQQVFTAFFNDVSATDASSVFQLAYQLIIATFVFAGAMRTLPQFASGIITGAAMGGGGASGSGSALASAVAGGVATGIAAAAGAGIGAAGGVKMAAAAGGGGWSKLGHGLAGALKGGYGGEKGELFSFMRRRAYKSYERTFGPDYDSAGQAQQARAYNSITPPDSNPNNVPPQ